MGNGETVDEWMCRMLLITAALVAVGVWVTGCVSNAPTPQQAEQALDRAHGSGGALVAALEAEHAAGRLSEAQWERISDFYRVRVAIGAEIHGISQPGVLPDVSEAQAILTRAKAINAAWVDFIEPLLSGMQISLVALSQYHSDQAILRQYADLAARYLENPDADRYRQMAAMGFAAARVLTGIAL